MFQLKREQNDSFVFTERFQRMEYKNLGSKIIIINCRSDRDFLKLIFKLWI